MDTCKVKVRNSPHQFGAFRDHAYYVQRTGVPIPKNNNPKPANALSNIIRTNYQGYDKVFSIQPQARQAHDSLFTAYDPSELYYREL
jgi:hypothetical protein